jgi:4-alpha-glucanotransferase
VPWKLRADRYQPFIETIRAGLRHAGGLRVDHVMGLFRLFWIPPGSSPAEGAYVRFRAEELLDILAIESVRSGAFVVGEDLGTIEDDARAELARRRVLSYRLLWFEDGPPSTFPEQALAAISTHDLPTVAGVWTGSDLEAQRELGLEPNEEGMAELRERLAAAGAGEGDDVDEAVASAYRSLAGAPSQVVLATLDDALGVAERPNMPGTVDEWPNWSIALPVPLEEAEEDPRVLAVAKALHDGR